MNFNKPWHKHHVFDLNPGTTIGVVSDIHANNVALDAVLDDMDTDYLINLGDVVGYGPHPQETFTRMMDEADINIRGNHDNNVSDPIYRQSNQQAYQGLVHANNELTDEQIETVSTLPHMATVNDRFVFAHSHPNQPEQRGEYVTDKNLTTLQSDFSRTKADIIGVGHSHIQLNTEISKYGAQEAFPRVVLNPGSVGQPRDNDYRPSYAVITIKNDEAFSVTHHRVEYDYQSVIDDINDAGLPTGTGERLRP